MAREVKKSDEMRAVRDAVENEGFDYAFRNYSDFKEVKAAEFHRLRKLYCDAADAFQDYVGSDED